MNYMSFKRKKKAGKSPNTITLTKLTTGNKHDYYFDPKQGPVGNLARFLREFDDEGYPLFFADEKIAGLPIRVKDADIEQRMNFYIEQQKKGKSTSRSTPVPAKIAVKADAITKAVKKAVNKKAAGAAKKAKAEPAGDAA